MRVIKSLSALAAVPLLFATPAAATVLQVAGGSGQRSLTLTSYGPLGQSFVASDTSLTSFGFQLQTLNSGATNDALTLSLLSGGGLDGAVLATRMVTPTGIPATRTPTWLDFDLGGTALVVGQTYTAVLSSTSSRLGLIYGPDINLLTNQPTGGDAYAPGVLLATGFNDATCNRNLCDTNFRLTSVTPATAVPEPAGWLTMIAGFGVVGGALRRRTVTMAA